MIVHRKSARATAGVAIVLCAILGFAVDRQGPSGFRAGLHQIVTQENIQQELPAQVVLAPSGLITLNGLAVTRDELKREVLSAKDTGNRVTTTVSADGPVKYGDVIALLDLLRGIGLSEIALPLGRLNGSSESSPTLYVFHELPSAGFGSR